MKLTSQKKAYLLKFSFGIILSISLVLGLVFYMIQSNTINAQKYQAKNLEKDILELKHQLEEAESKSASKKSYKNLEEFVQNSEMIKIPQAHYLSFIQKEFAKR